MIMWFNHVKNPACPIETYPEPAAIFSLNQNRYRNISPSQKTGADTPKSANPMARRSPRERGRSAERTPIGMPSRSHTSAAPAASWAVTTRRLAMIGFRGARELNENPSPGQPYASPPKMCRTNSTYW